MFIQHYCRQCHLSCTDTLNTFQSLPDHHQVSVLSVPPQYSRKSAVFSWVHGQGLPGNKATDIAALWVPEQALGTDVHAFPHCTVLSSRQDKWTSKQGNKLQVAKPHLQVRHYSFNFIQEENMLTCLQIGHTLITRGHLFHGEQFMYLLFFVWCSRSVPLCKFFLTPLCLSSKHKI